MDYILVNAFGSQLASKPKDEWLLDVVECNKTRKKTRQLQWEGDHLIKRDDDNNFNSVIGKLIPGSIDFDGFNLTKWAKTATDKFVRDWITGNAVDICAEYDYGVLTLRALHYQLVGLGMTNSLIHYKRVVNAMIYARRNHLIPYEQFSDHDREMLGETNADETDFDDSVSKGIQQVQAWMENYSRNRWENQPTYIEVWIEKKALQGVFSPICEELEVALCPCKGYPSLTFLYEASKRFIAARERGKHPLIVYFGDHDPSGEDIPRSIQENFFNDFDVDVEVDVRALSEQQCRRLKLPPAPAKKTDSRTKNFHGLGQVELDAVKPKTLQGWVRKSVEENFDKKLHGELMILEATEREAYQSELKEFFEKY